MHQNFVKMFFFYHMNDQQDTLIAEIKTIPKKKSKKLDAYPTNSNSIITYNL